MDSVHVGQRAVARTGKNPALWFLAGLGMAIFGTGLLAHGVRTSAVRMGAVGLIFTAGGLWLVNERVRVWGRRSPSKFLVGGAASVVAGAAVMKLAFDRSQWWLTLVALAVLVAGLLCVAAYLSQATPEGARWNIPVGLVIGLLRCESPGELLPGLGGTTLGRGVAPTGSDWSGCGFEGDAVVHGFELGEQALW